MPECAAARPRQRADRLHGGAGLVLLLAELVLAAQEAEVGGVEVDQARDGLRGPVGARGIGGRRRARGPRTRANGGRAGFWAIRALSSRRTWMSSMGRGAQAGPARGGRGPPGAPGERGRVEAASGRAGNQRLTLGGRSRILRRPKAPAASSARGRQPARIRVQSGSQTTLPPTEVLAAMGYADNRHTPKMRQRQAEQADRPPQAQGGRGQGDPRGQQAAGPGRVRQQEDEGPRRRPTRASRSRRGRAGLSAGKWSQRAGSQSCRRAGPRSSRRRSSSG